MSQQNISINYVIKNRGQLGCVKDLTLIRGYHQIFEQYPGLHPDGFDEADSGWPEDLRVVCAEMWRRAESSESSVKPDHMYYINKAFRKLVADSARRTAGRRAFAKCKSFQA